MTARTGSLTTVSGPFFGNFSHASFASLMPVETVYFGSFSKASFASLVSSGNPYFFPFSQNRQGAWSRTFNSGFLPDLETPMTVVQVLQNTATTVSVFMRDGATGLGFPGIAPSAFTIKLKKSNQVVFSTITPTVTDTGLGWYDLAITASHTDTFGKAPMEIAATNALTRDDLVLDVIALNKFTDSVRAGLTALPNVNAGSMGGLATNAIRTGTAQGAGNGINQIQLDAGASSVDGTYSRSLISIIGGTGSNQSRFIASYAGSNKMATVNRNWGTQPDGTSVFEIVGASNSLLDEGLAQAGGSNTMTLRANDSSTDDIYKDVWFQLSAGAGSGQSRQCKTYNGTTKIATFYVPWATGAIPDGTTVYQVLTGVATIPAGATGVAGAVGGLAVITAVGQGPGGQIKANSFNDKYVYDVTGKMTSCRMRVFANKATADTASDSDADGAHGEVERFRVTATYNTDGTLKTYEYAKEL